MPNRMSDTKLFQLGRKLAAAKQAVKDAQADAKAIQDRIIPELESRGTKAIEGAGIRLNMVTGEDTRYDLDDMKEHLSPSLYKKCVKEVPDPEAIKALVDAGKIRPKTLAKFSRVIPKSPYVLPTVREQ